MVPDEVLVKLIAIDVQPNPRTNGSTRLQKNSVVSESYSAGKVGPVNRCPAPG
jgi:hypothetical protein